MKIKTAKEILREMEISNCILGDDEYFIDTDEDHVINAMIVYAEQFINLATEEAIIEIADYDEDTRTPIYGVDSESILKIKEQIK